MLDIPRETQAESSLSLLGEGYSFIPSRCQRLGTDLFQVRLLMQNTICMSGEEAAKLFYDEQLFQRQHAAPRMLQKTLFGQGGVQGLDGDAHRHRKLLFLSLFVGRENCRASAAERGQLADGDRDVATVRSRDAHARSAGNPYPRCMRLGWSAA